MHEMQKNHIFFMEFHPKTFNFKMVLDLIDVYQYHSPLKKFTQNFHI
jgi:hypothetical protein